MTLTSIMTPDERAMRAADEAASAEGAARLLAALIPALNAAIASPEIPGYIAEGLRNRVACLLSVVDGFAEKFERAL